MTIYATLIARASSIVERAQKTGSLTKKAKRRLKALDWHHSHGSNVSLTIKDFGIHRETIGVWIKRLLISPEAPFPGSYT